MSTLFKRGAVFLSGVLLASAACAQAFPNKPVTLLVPYPAGGLSDVIARTVNAPLGRALGQPVIVENLGGASGGIAAQKVLNAPSDGYMLFQGSPNELILAPLALSSVKYKSEDFRQIHRIALAPMAIIARGDIPANNADELVAYAMKVAKEGKPMTYASVGVGSLYHLLGEQMSKMIGVPMLHIPYKGFADGLKDLMGNQVDIFITPYGAPQVALAKDKKIKFIAATSPGAHPLLPQLGRTSDSKSALKNFTSEIGTGYFVKRDTPEPIVQAMHKGLQAVLGDAEYLSRMAALGQLASPLQTLDVANKAFVDETTQYRAIAKAINLQAQ
ncbi:MAG: tripartite tricarboxylate transporter substrate binding protein [Polaromonas sp.]|nr:tripartite tricarboxylate transporter substrate binding protein [Polaromonas sp.]MBP6155772.1 tripartite tricarboxylate transporter substrate binding protein [Polaromonas sp.]MBP7116006.1 tripartite tricarboxylate transporter substrate binding protein [Polaromonas sp.]MBP7307739.1 tripartite tricarboxylate transporter substrate binding protein [Polaromonas sp.]MBP8873749.1 tripartite tricarboxylate transporter substrate binding protein [Polaromonas sp.]